MSYLYFGNNTNSSTLAHLPIPGGPPSPTASRHNSLSSMGSSSERSDSNHSVCSYMTNTQETPEARRFRREFRMQQVELMELTALGLNKGKSMSLDLKMIKMMEEQNLELSQHDSRRGSGSTRRATAPATTTVPASLLNMKTGVAGASDGSSGRSRPTLSRVLSRRRQTSSVCPQA